MSVTSILFWLAAAALIWVYVGYPTVAAVVARVRPFRPRPDVAAHPLVTVGIAAHNEARHLASRVANIVDQAGPFDLEVIVASDGSTDDSASIMARLAAADPRIVFLDLERGGQTDAQNAIFAAAHGDVVVLSDAETRFAPGCLASLVAPLADSRVGCSTGRLEWLEADRTQTSRSEGLYWRYEQLVRAVESRAGWLTAVTGALLAIRRELYRPVAPSASMDHLLPLYVRAAGRVVVAVPDAVAMDRPISGLRAQFRNRSRTATRGIRSNLSMAGALAPWRRPTAALAIWSHKLLRWATPLLLGLMGATAIVEAVLGGSPFYLLPLLGLIGIAVLAILAWFLRRGRISPPRLAAFALTIAVVNIAFVAGWWNLVRGRRIATWERTKWQAGSVRPGAADLQRRDPPLSSR